VPLGPPRPATSARRPSRRTAVFRRGVAATATVRVYTRRLQGEPQAYNQACLVTNEYSYSKPSRSRHLPEVGPGTCREKPADNNQKREQRSGRFPKALKRAFRRLTVHRRTLVMVFGLLRLTYGLLKLFGFLKND